MKFKDTKIGIVPSHWEVQPIKEITEIVTDYVANGSFASLAENVINSLERANYSAAK